MKINDFENNFVFTQKINLNDEGDFVVLREPNFSEFGKLNATEENQMFEALKELLPAIIVDHSFVKEDGSKASATAVATALEKSGSQLLEILTEWQDNLPLKKKMSK